MKNVSRLITEVRQTGRVPGCTLPLTTSNFLDIVLCVPFVNTFFPSGEVLTKLPNLHTHIVKCLDNHLTQKSQGYIVLGSKPEIKLLYLRDVQ